MCWCTREGVNHYWYNKNPFQSILRIAVQLTKIHFGNIFFFSGITENNNKNETLAKLFLLMPGGQFFWSVKFLSQKKLNVASQVHYWATRWFESVHFVPYYKLNKYSWEAGWFHNKKSLNLFFSVNSPLGCWFRLLYEIVISEEILLIGNQGPNA